MNWLIKSMVIISGVIFLNSCVAGVNEKVYETKRVPVIEPDYSNVTIPVNIAPLNFIIREKGDLFHISAIAPDGKTLKLNSSDTIVCFPFKSWKKLLSGSKGGRIAIEISTVIGRDSSFKYDPFYLNIAEEPVDEYLCYRLLYPGYETYLDIKIVQRDITSFKEKSLIENQLLNNNCINCHTFRTNDPERFMVHIRGSMGGTYFIKDGKIIRTDLKTDQLATGAVYPAWHPGGRYIAFSSNNIKQSFHSSPEENIEVTDLSALLVIYDTDKNILSPVGENDTVIKYMNTFPEWSPDGKYLYFCRALQYNEGDDLKGIKYDLMRIPFNEESGSFGNAEKIFDARAINKSVSFPRISPDGRYLVFTLHDYGNFSIWHKEADLYLMELQDGKSSKMSLNSNETESYHSWSSNGKWLVFSSKRGDGLTARPYFSYFGSPDNVGKPFVLPQKDPTLYARLVKTFNRPEFVTGKIKFGPRDFEKAARNSPLKALWFDNK